jgi:NADPH-dependent 2,4-dienoyl-CoA reductase/sulfur reductase-like enzyme
MSERMVVIGGGAAGMSAASAARRTNPALDVVVLEATSYIAYGLCGLPYYLSGVVETADDLFAYPMERFTKDRGIDVRTAAVVTEIDPDGRWVVYRQGERTHRLSYSSLVVTAGASPVQVELPDIGADRTFAVRTLEEAIALRGLLDAGKVGSALVVGAGYIGLEMAEALVERGCSVTVVERLDQVLPTFDAEVAAVVEEHVRGRVDLRLDTDATAPGLPTVDLAVVSVGVRPGAALAAAAGAAVGPSGALLVDAEMRTTLPGVWAAGDCVAPLHRVTGKPAYVPLGTTANKTGRVAGTVAAGGSARFAGIVGTAVVKVFDLEVARTGITIVEARAAGIEAVATDVVHRSRAKYYPGGSTLHVRLVHGAGGRLLGAQMVGREGAAQRIDVLAAALQTGMTVGDLTELDLAYAPPYSPVYDPILIAAEIATRHLEAS